MPLPDAAIQAVWVSWTPLLRVQSGCPPSVRQTHRDKKEQENVPPAAIGLRKKLLAIKLQWRKHMASGSRMVRRRMCRKKRQAPLGSTSLSSTALRDPFGVVFADECGLAEGNPRGWRGPTFRANSAAWPDTTAGGTHSIWRGADRGIIESGGKFALPRIACQCRSTARNVYPELGAEEAAAVAETPIGRCDYEGPGGRGPRGHRFP